MGSPWRKTSLLAAFFRERFMEKVGHEQCSEGEEIFRNGRNATRQGGSHQQKQRRKWPRTRNPLVWGRVCFPQTQKSLQQLPAVEKATVATFPTCLQKESCGGLLLKQSLSPYCWQFLEVVGETHNRNGIHPPWCPHPQRKIRIMEEHLFWAAGSHLWGANSLGAQSPVLASEVPQSGNRSADQVVLSVSAEMLE